MSFTGKSQHFVSFQAWIGHVDLSVLDLYTRLKKQINERRVVIRSLFLRNWGETALMTISGLPRVTLPYKPAIKLLYTVCTTFFYGQSAILWHLKMAAQVNSGINEKGITSPSLHKLPV